MSAADTGYTWWVDMTEFDVFVGDWAGTANLRASGPGAGTLDASDALDLYYVLVNFSYNTFWAGWSEEYFVLWTMACVIGKHGLPLQGSVSAPNNGRGIRVSDMVPYILSTWAPLLVKGDIEATTFAVPHAVFLEPTTAMAMIESLVLFGGTTGRILDWWVYDDRTFGMGSPGNYGSVWRTRYEEDAATANGQGPDAQRMINGVVVEYDAGDGQTKTVGPPGARVDSQQLTLQDLSDSNPCNRTGARHWEVYNAGVTTQAGAILIGQLILAERNRQEWRGDITIPGRVRDSYGNWVPAFMVRAGDHIIIEDDADTRQRRIISTSYSAEDDAVTLSVGAPPDRLDVLLARAGVVLVGKV